MGSCLSKPSSKGTEKKKKKKKGFHNNENVVPQHETQPSKTSVEVEEWKEVEAAASSTCRVSTGSLQLAQSDHTPSPASSSLTLNAVEKCHDPKVPPSSSSDKLQSSSSSMIPDMVTFTVSQSPRKKYSGEFPNHSFRNPSQCRSVIQKAPFSPGGMKKATTLHKNEEDDCKFPSLARKQWLSQACPAKSRGEDECSTNKARKSADESSSKDKVMPSAAMKTPASREVLNSAVSKDPCKQKSMNSIQEHDSRTSEHSSKIMSVGAPTVKGNIPDTRTNSLSRDVSPIEILRTSKPRTSSPLRRSPATKDTTILITDGPRLLRNASGKASSPNRAGYYASERHETVKARPSHKQSHSREHFMDPVSEISTHRRTSSKESTSEFNIDIIRRPSPPKKTPIVVATCASSSSSDAARINTKRPSKPSKENSSFHKSIMQEPSFVTKGGKNPGQRNLDAAVNEIDSLACNNNRNGRRREKSPPRRISTGVAPFLSSTRSNDRNADLSINSDTTLASHFDPMGKDMAARTKKPVSRAPLKEISNVNSSLPSRSRIKENHKSVPKASESFREETDALSLPKDEYLINGNAVPEKNNVQALCDFSTNLNDCVKDPLETKAENLVMEGKSVLSAFKALEEYRLKYSYLNVEPHQDGNENLSYSRLQPYAAPKESCSQPLQGSLDMGKGPLKSAVRESHESPRLPSTKKSGEQFLFSDVQSLLISEKRSQPEGGMAMPPSISKACSILRAVADLNMGNTVYSKMSEVQDEIERPNLLSFQFGEGNSGRVTSSQAS
ncbi:hypothetical protein KP509_16G017300 [Ceratopteris richardii]|uniref:Uncharacterized protein n=1 Tax=Ceratopteris richardii TaxID=49495 RepID=A0A8T2T151_CERRI|nr:hypothetical protein KP509_16G017300 [Ceratopteris richardii]KAH7387336.1 hypothetical protein KP509_16G017300 [Ceratopteris richardii]